MSTTNEIMAGGLFPERRPCPYSDPELYAALRESQPVSKVNLRNGKSVWILTRYADIRAMLTDSRISADAYHPGYPKTRDDPAESQNKWARPFNQMDPPRHTYYRRMLIPEFTMKRLREMRPGIRAIADQLIDDMLAKGSPADLVDAYSLPVPSLVICQLL